MGGSKTSFNVQSIQQPNTYSRLGQPQLQHHPDLEADKFHDCKNKQVEDRNEPHLKQILLPLRKNQSGLAQSVI